MQFYIQMHLRSIFCLSIIFTAATGAPGPAGACQTVVAHLFDLARPFEGICASVDQEVRSTFGISKIKDLATDLDSLISLLGETRLAKVVGTSPLAFAPDKEDPWAKVVKIFDEKLEAIFAQDPIGDQTKKQIKGLLYPLFVKCLVNEEVKQIQTCLSIFSNGLPHLVNSKPFQN